MGGVGHAGGRRRRSGQPDGADTGLPRAHQQVRQQHLVEMADRSKSELQRSLVNKSGSRSNELARGTGRANQPMAGRNLEQ